MHLQQPTPDDIPYIRVGRDARGSACWEVVDRGEILQASSGTEAVERCEERRRAREGWA